MNKDRGKFHDSYWAAERAVDDPPVNTQHETVLCRAFGALPRSPFAAGQLLGFVMLSLKTMFFQPGKPLGAYRCNKIVHGEI